MLAVDTWSRAVLMFPRVTQTDILDVPGQKLLPPKGSPPVRLEPADLTFLDLLTRDMGRVVTHDEMIAAVWPNGCDELVSPLQALRTRAYRLRGWLARIGWTERVLLTRDGAGWEMDRDEVARCLREARGE